MRHHLLFYKSHNDHAFLVLSDQLANEIGDFKLVSETWCLEFTAMQILDQKMDSLLR